MWVWDRFEKTLNVLILVMVSPLGPHYTVYVRMCVCVCVCLFVISVIKDFVHNNSFGSVINVEVLPIERIAMTCHVFYDMVRIPVSDMLHGF